MPQGTCSHTILRPSWLVNDLGLPLLPFASCFMSQFILIWIISYQQQWRSYTANKFILYRNEIYILQVKQNSRMLNINITTKVDFEVLALHELQSLSYQKWTKRYETKTMGEINILFISLIPTIWFIHVLLLRACT